MATTSRVTIRESFDMPSRGKFPGIPERITLRAMSLMDEKQRLASSGLAGIVDLIGNCIVEPENIDAHDMPMFDIDWAMLKLRVVSHGPVYKATVSCPHCGHVQSVDIDLDSIELVPVEDDFSAEFEMGPLPVSGDTLTVKILTFKDLEDMENESKRILAKFPEYKGDPTDVLDYIYKIVMINGEKRPYPHLKSYVESMAAADSIYFDQVYGERLGKYGPDTLLPFTCESCNEAFMRNMPMNSEFFRPRYDTTKR